MVSTLSENGELKVQLVERDVPELKPSQILVRVEAAPINPSDLGVMIGRHGISDGFTTGTGASTTFTAKVSDAALKAMTARIGKRLPVGNEGAGTVVAAGEDDYAQSLIGRTVAIVGGGKGMYCQYRAVEADVALPLLEGQSAKDGASSFVNPMTSLSFVETMKMEGHSAIVQTAAASNLGQMLVRICAADGIDLVNIVRKPEQVELLRKMGAKHVVTSFEDSFVDDLTDAVHETGATIAFDAIGGGSMASDILTSMERAAARTPGKYSIYGSTKPKQVYTYGNLDQSPTILTRAYGSKWSVGVLLLTSFLASAGKETTARLRARVVAELKTTFVSHYTAEISLEEALQSDVVERYVAKATGEKYLICPAK